MPKPPRYFVSPLPSWSRKIKSLRAQRRLSQAALALRLKCSSMTVSRWERGLLKPTPESLIAMGEIAGPPVGWHFWRMAGISPSAIQRMQGTEGTARNRKPKKH